MKKELFVSFSFFFFLIFLHLEASPSFHLLPCFFGLVDHRRGEGHPLALVNGDGEGEAEWQLPASPQRIASLPKHGLALKSTKTLGDSGGAAPWGVHDPHHRPQGAIHKLVAEQICGTRDLAPAL